MLEKLIQGGPMMIPLVICSVMALAVIMDRFFAFYGYSKYDTYSLRAEVIDLVSQGKTNEAALLCASTPGPVSAVMLAGLQAFTKFSRLGEPPDVVRTSTDKSMQDYSLHAMSAVEKRLNVLSTVANAAPLFGMTGTVTGMIRSFKTLQELSGLDPGAVAGGISEALITTAAGLLIALFAVIPYNIFTSISEKIELEVEEASSELLEHLTIRTAAQPQSN